jgi:hypothetical protein
VTDEKHERSTARYSPARELLILAAVLAGAAFSTASQADRRARLLPCQIKDVQGDVRCGTIQVPENRSSRSSDFVQKGFAVGLDTACADTQDPVPFVLR